MSDLWLTQCHVEERNFSSSVREVRCLWLNVWCCLGGLGVSVGGRMSPEECKDLCYCDCVQCPFCSRVRLQATPTACCLLPQHSTVVRQATVGRLLAAGSYRTCSVVHLSVFVTAQKCLTEKELREKAHQGGEHYFEQALFFAMKCSKDFYPENACSN